MASIKKLEMAKVLSNDSRIQFTKSCFGLVQHAVYTPTNSRLQAFQDEYATDKGELLKQLLACPSDKLEVFVKSHAAPEKAAMGPARLEGCFSEDHQFAALQLLGYSDFDYRPLTEVKTYEGRDAEIISSYLS